MIGTINMIGALYKTIIEKKSEIAFHFIHVLFFLYFLKLPIKNINKIT